MIDGVGRRDLAQLCPATRRATARAVSSFAASRRGLAFERAYFSPDPLNGSSPDADGGSRLVNARADPQESLDLPFRLSVHPRPPNRFAALGALRSGLAHARNHALGKPLGLLLGHGGEHRQQDPADHLVIGTEVRLGVAMEGHAVGVQPLEMMDRRHHALAAKAVERPEQHAIELAAACGPEQCGKLLALARALAAAHAVNVFANNVVARIGAPGAQIAELVLRVLAFVLSRHPRIDRNAHDCLAGVARTVSLRTHRKQSFSACTEQTELLVEYQ